MVRSPFVCIYPASRYACTNFLAAMFIQSKARRMSLSSSSNVLPKAKEQSSYPKVPWSSMSDMGSVPSESTVHAVSMDVLDAGLTLPTEGLKTALFYSSSFCTCATCSQSSTARSDLS